ncbi:Uncharacterised protein [Campylobacter devanensis]|uniref:Uncharacterized protein n=1 Tax=Campylobacter devanensis TaxID=3161138 RepID=A0A1X9SUH4_9BACT|nr:hypothetical protein [Campylobacter lanienae]ARQ99842.1 hypothetical protein CIGN_1607 [Campylobacter lanienae]SUX03094.1 Uncharacterised protein [Campylobacter lanienae]
MSINMTEIIKTLQGKRQIFCSEADFQLEMALVIKEMYTNAKVRLEYVPTFDDKMHIDILVFISNKWIPIELKYKTKNSKKEEMIDKITQEVFNLKNQGAKDIGCYLYLKDIMRIESIKEQKIEIIKGQEKNNFKEGYAVFLTNDKTYLESPQNNDCVYKDFSLQHGITKHGELKWAEHTGAGTKKGIEDPIILKGSYTMEWKNFSNVNEERSDGTFYYLVTKII